MIDADGSRYYSNSDGVMHTGWLQDGGHWYFMRGNGAMATGWRDMDGSWYFFNQDGQMVTGWQSIDGIWYYFDGNGHMATGITDVGGVKYYLDDRSGRGRRRLPPLESCSSVNSPFSNVSFRGGEGTARLHRFIIEAAGRNCNLFFEERGAHRYHFLLCKTPQ